MQETTITFTFYDGADGSPVDPGTIDRVVLEPAPIATLAPNVFSVERGRTYRADVRPKRGLYRPTIVDVDACDGDLAVEVPVPRRTAVLYVTIDARRDMGHGPNLEGLRAAVEASQLGLEVRQVWYGDVRDKTAADFDDEGTFLFFFSGSFTEWQEYGHNDDWRDLVDRLSALMRDTDVPAIAVCGSHQLLARAFADDWRAVAHMSSGGGAPVPIADELATSPPRDLIPSPRVSEVGTFPLRSTAEGADDPVLLGLAGRPLLFTESHADEVVDERRSPHFAPLLEPDLTRDALAISPIAAGDRCKVQALRYVGPRRRMLYSCQFHPELFVHPSFSGGQRAQAELLGTDGLQFIINLVEAAKAFWVALPGANA